MKTLALDREMARRNDVTVKVDAEAVRIAKIAASFKDMSLAEYLTNLVMTHAPRDIDEGHSQLTKGQGRTEPQRPKRAKRTEGGKSS